MKSKRNAVQTRLALMAAASDVFAQHGFEGATLARISRQARVNKAMISYHFGGKRRLYIAILEDGLDLLAKKIAPLSTREMGPEERFMAFLEAFRAVVLERPSFPRFILRESISGGSSLNARIMNRYLEAFNLTKDIISQGVETGLFRNTTPEYIHNGLFGNLVLFYATAKLRQRLQGEIHLPLGTIDSTQYLQHWVQMILHGLIVDPIRIHRNEKRL
jgi:TetR/AcrR family transcriptional regulator